MILLVQIAHDTYDIAADIPIGEKQYRNNRNLDKWAKTREVSTQDGCPKQKVQCITDSVTKLTVNEYRSWHFI